MPGRRRGLAASWEAKEMGRWDGERHDAAAEETALEGWKMTVRRSER